MTNTLPYIPNVDIILQTVRSIQGMYITEVLPHDSYSDWVCNNIMLQVDGKWRIVDDKSLLLLGSYDAQCQFLWDNVLSCLPASKIVIQLVNGKSYEDIMSATNTLLSTQDVRLVLAWMERLNVIILKDGVYFLTDDTPETIDSEIDVDSQVINVVDVKDEKYSVFDYLRKIRKGTVILNPDFQRNEVWSIEQNSRFIESLILNIPIPSFYLKEDNKGKRIVVDGLQRTTALQKFFAGEYALTGLQMCPQLNGKTINDFETQSLLTPLLTRIEDKQLYFYIMPLSCPMSVVYDVFNRINTGGTNLSTQEIRNCLLIGNSTRLLKELAQLDIVNEAIDNGIRDKRMKLREAILRCLAFVVLDYNKIYKGSMNSYLEKTMIAINNMSSMEVEQVKQDFITTIQTTYRIYRDRNFRIPTYSTRGRLNIAVMETIFYCHYQLEQAGITKTDQEFKTDFNKLLNNSIYIDAVRNSTASLQKVYNRFSEASKQYGI